MASADTLAAESAGWTDQRVTVVVLNWNGCSDTVECLESLLPVRYAPLSVVMVDNGSTDGSVEEVRRRFPDVEVLETGSNLGFAEGNNVGIRYALDQVAFGGEMSPLKVYYTFRNRLLWAERHLALGQRLGVHWAVYADLIRRLLGAAASSLKGGKRPARQRVWAVRGAFTSPVHQAWAAGVRDYWLRRFGPCPDDVTRLQQRWLAMREAAAGR